jgi:antitoxin PrlF
MRIKQCDRITSEAIMAATTAESRLKHRKGAATAKVRSVDRVLSNRSASSGNVSRVTDKAQTTLPKGVRNALGATPGSTLKWDIQGNRAIVQVQEAEHEDPAVGAFLKFLAADMIAHPENLRPLQGDLIVEAKELTVGVKFDLNERLE